MDTSHWTNHRDTLARLIERRRFGIVSDFDGTLSLFAERPNAAVMLPSIVETLDRLSEKVTVVALVSGRAVADLRSRFERPWAVYYGNHGMEFWHAEGVHTAAEAQAYVEPLDALLAALGEVEIPGVYIEDKGVTASVHYRNAGDREAAGRVLHERLQPLCEWYGFELSSGHFIWEIKPPITVNKGTAVQTIVEEHALESVLFLGDDVTDITAMSRLRALRDGSSAGLAALSVGVLNPNGPPNLRDYCDLTASGVDDTQALLAWVDHMRPVPPT